MITLSREAQSKDKYHLDIPPILMRLYINYFFKLIILLTHSLLILKKILNPKIINLVCNMKNEV